MSFTKKILFHFALFVVVFLRIFLLVFYKSGREKDPGMLPEPLQS